MDVEKRKAEMNSQDSIIINMPVADEKCDTCAKRINAPAKVVDIALNGVCLCRRLHASGTLVNCPHLNHPRDSPSLNLPCTIHKVQSLAS